MSESGNDQMWFVWKGIISIRNDNNGIGHPTCGKNSVNQKQGARKADRLPLQVMWRHIRNNPTIFPERWIDTNVK